MRNIFPHVRKHTLKIKTIVVLNPIHREYFSNFCGIKAMGNNVSPSNLLKLQNLAT